MSKEKKVTESLMRQIESFQFVFEHAPVGMVVADIEGNVIAINKAMQELTYHSLDDLTISGITVIYATPDERKRMLGILQEAGRVRNFETVLRRKDGTQIVALMSVDLVEVGGKKVVFTTVRDITERKHAEDAILARDEMIRKLSVPLVEVAEGILLLPVIGMLDSARSKELTQSVLEHVARTNVDVIVIDISGIFAIDTKTANYLLRTMQAVGLMGSQTIITGIRPDVAVTLATLGIDLSGVVTRRTLREGLEYAYENLGFKLVRK